MADDFGSAQTADLAAGGERQSAGQAIKEAAGVKIARSGGVDDTGNRRGRDETLGAWRQDHAARRAPGQGGDRDMPAHGGRGSSEVSRLIERADLGFVGEEDVDFAVDEIAKRRAMPPDT